MCRKSLLDFYQCLTAHHLGFPCMGVQYDTVLLFEEDEEVVLLMSFGYINSTIGQLF